MVERSYGGRSVAERQAERRERFMAAALDVFGTSGYAQGTISAICAAAGLSRRQFYEVFDSREELLVAVYDMIHDEAHAAVLTAFASVDASTTEIGDRVRPAIAAFFDSVATDPRRIQIAFIEVGGVSARVETHRQEKRAEWIEFFSATAAVVAPDLPESQYGFDYEAAAFIGALAQAGHLWASRTYRPDRDVVVDMLATIIVSLADARRDVH